jgi:hypothetical protein
MEDTVSLHFCVVHLRNHYADSGDLVLVMVPVIYTETCLPGELHSPDFIFLKMAHGLESWYVIQNTDFTAVYNFYLKHYFM